MCVTGRKSLISITNETIGNFYCSVMFLHCVDRALLISCSLHILKKTVKQLKHIKKKQSVIHTGSSLYSKACRLVRSLAGASSWVQIVAHPRSLVQCVYLAAATYRRRWCQLSKAFSTNKFALLVVKVQLLCCQPPKVGFSVVKLHCIQLAHIKTEVDIGLTCVCSTLFWILG